MLCLPDRQAGVGGVFNKIIAIGLLFFLLFGKEGHSQIGRALNFDGVNDRVSLPVALTQNLTTVTVTEITIEYWFRGGNLQSAVRFQPEVGTYIVAGWGPAGSPKHVISSDGGTAGGLNIGSTANDGNWHHIAMTWQKNTVNGFKSYLDGVLVAQRNSANVNLPGMAVSGYLGSFNGTSEFMFGSLDKVRIWNRALPQSEINGNKYFEISSGAGLIVSYNFNQGIAAANNFGVNSLTDATTNNYSGTLSNFALNGNSSNWIAPGSSPLYVNVTGAIVNNGGYEALSDAMARITNFSQLGANINVTIDSSIIEISTIVLNNRDWSTLTIKPTPGRAVTISGSMSPGVSLLTLNGADKVTIDGLNSGGSSLTFSNTTISSMDETSTIRFQNDATNNLITRCKIYGSSITNFSAPCATVLFGGNSTIAGNDNNVVSFCDIGPAGTNLPACAVYFAGTTTNSTLNNSNDTIRNCNIFDYFNPLGQSAGIMVSSGSTATTIANNKLHQTGARSLVTTFTEHSSIKINNSSGSDFRVSGNTIGYSSSSGTGIYNFEGSQGSVFHGIFARTSTTSESIIFQNTIAGIFATLKPDIILDPFEGIGIKDGFVSVNDNTIGSLTSPSISLATTSTLEGHYYAIRKNGTGDWTTNSNKIGGIHVAILGPASSFYGLRFTSSGTSVWNCSGNTVGGTNQYSIRNQSEHTFSFSYGISATGSINCLISSNTIQNMLSFAGFAGVNAIVGINLGVSNQLVEKNIIHALTNQNIMHPSSVTGIATAGTGNINSNLIHSLSVLNPSAKIYGFIAGSGSCTYANNMIRLGAINSNSSNIMGISELSGTNNFYYNSVYIEGNAFDASNTFAFHSTTLNTRNYVNNIFYNGRSNTGSTGKHYAIRVGGTTPDPAGLNCNYNDLYVSGNGGVLGFYNNVDRPNLTSWQLATGQDSASISSDPKFVAGFDLHIDSTANSPINSKGKPIAGITIDYDGNIRNASTPDIGADEFNGIAGTINVNLTMFIEGFYSSGSNSQASDTLKVYLRNTNSPYNLIDSAKSVIASNGTAALTFSNASTGAYYIVLTHRNSIETWSSSGVLMTKGNTISYNFSNEAVQAYGDNMKQVDGSPVRFGIYSGDVNQDGIIDAGDLSQVDNDAFNSVSGYVVTDVNGDDFVDASDLSIVDNNAFTGVIVQIPFVVNTLRK